MSKSALVYADINPSAIDGSSIWMMSITEVLSRVFDRVTLLLKCTPTDYSLLESLSELENVFLDFPEADAAGESPIEHSISQCADRAEILVQQHATDVILVRGFDACNEFCLRPRLSKVLWSYVTDLPFPPSKISRNALNRLERISSRSAGLFAQTEASRAYLEALAKSAPGKVVLLPPMIPEAGFAEIEQIEPNSAKNFGQVTEPLQLVYAGKFAKDWKTLEMLDLPGELEKLGVAAKLNVVGSKVNNDKTDPEWRIQMLEALERAKSGEIVGVNYYGGLPRSETLSIIKKSHIGLGWRTAKLDSSLEISTKALEYSAAGVPPIINRTPDHELLLGREYPFFVDNNMNAADLAKHIKAKLDDIGIAGQKARGAVEYYSMSAAAKRLIKIWGLDRNTFVQFTTPQEPTKLLVASHDLKFAGELITQLQKDPRFEVRFDHWDSLHKHDEAAGREFAQWADAIFCEFAGPNLAFYSHAKPTHTKLFARLHGFEVRNKARWFKDVDFEQVDGIITVSEHYKAETEKFLPEISDRVLVLPNMIDCNDFDRAKSSGAQYVLGMVGMVPFLKRPDRALDLLEKLLDEDPRFVLRIRGRMPWDYPYVWNSSLEKNQYLDFFKKVTSNNKLRDHVVFDEFGTDMAAWLRGVGFVLSPSDVESFHLAPAEGMSSGAIPIVWNRPGAEAVFGPENVYNSYEDMVRRICDLRDNTYQRHSQNAKNYASKWDIRIVYEKWAGLFQGVDE